MLRSIHLVIPSIPTAINASFHIVRFKGLTIASIFFINSKRRGKAALRSNRRSAERKLAAHLAGLPELARCWLQEYITKLYNSTLLLIGDHCLSGYVAKFVATTLNAFGIDTQANA
jgi:hypothetical protein